ncbi:MAG: hypothetical protein LBS51_03565, partial [Oscillospiraceae bacterium]|nr:hypothetical protein [Oscillospiraceae bacterium]
MRRGAGLAPKKARGDAVLKDGSGRRTQNDFSGGSDRRSRRKKVYKLNDRFFCTSLGGKRRKVAKMQGGKSMKHLSRFLSLAL